MKNINYYQSFFKSIQLLSIFIFIFNIYGCAVNPVTGKNEFMLISEHQEIALGKKYDKEILKQYKLYNNPKIANYVSSVGKKLLKYVHRPKLKYYFRLLDSTEVNAFAIPGGYVYITRGLLAYLNNEAQLAGVLGHELGHINARHSAKQLSSSILAQLGLTVGMIAVPELKSVSNIISEGVKLLFLKFSRDDERQADYLGVYYSSLAGYDSNEMGNFFNTLKRLSPQQEGLPDWFSTHPSPEHRIVKVNKETLKIHKKLHFAKYIINKNEYLTNINGLLFGKNPAEGFRENGYFYHPVLKFKFKVPKNWKLQNTPSKVILVSTMQDSIIIFHLSNSSLKETVNKYLSTPGLQTYSLKDININGFKAVKAISVVKSKNLVVFTYFIFKDNKTYEFNCAYKNYNEKYYQIPFSFSSLTDPSKLNKKPSFIIIKKAEFTSNFREILNSYGVYNNTEIEKLSLLNGIYPDTILKKGELFKLIK